MRFIGNSWSGWNFGVVSRPLHRISENGRGFGIGRPLAEQNLSCLCFWIIDHAAFLVEDHGLVPLRLGWLPLQSWLAGVSCPGETCPRRGHLPRQYRSEEHTSELQSLRHLVCRLLL